jgi:hypothetical protein
VETPAFRPGRKRRHADVNAAINIAVGHAVTARGGDGVTRPVNREPQLLLQSALEVESLAFQAREDVNCQSGV